jgi:diguanylate cyclase (GGDEF)-like protein/PAS domain S-box-containing protein
MFTFIEYSDVGAEQDSETSRVAEGKFRALFNSITDCMLILDLNGYIRNINQSGYQRLGYTREEILGLHITQLEAPESTAQITGKITSLKQQGHAIFESAHVRKDGSIMPVEINCKLIELGGEHVFFSVIRDISERKREQRARQMMQFSIDRMGDAVFWATPDARVTYANVAACQSLGYAQEEMLNLHISQFSPEFTLATWQAHWDALKKCGSFSIESTHRTKDGNTFPVEITLNYLQYETEEFNCAFVRDITKRKLAEERIVHLAHFDALTNLPNRTLFYDRFEQAIAKAQRYKHKLAIFFLDLDGFKQINDKFGHQVGDSLLQAVATRLNENARGMDTVARVGGDEFIMILNDVDQAASAAIVAKKVVDVLAGAFTINDHQCQIGASLGISIYPEDSDDMDTLIKQADDAMYRAKNNGKSSYQFFNAGPVRKQGKAA